MTRARHFLAVLLPLSLALTACGDDSTDPGEGPTKGPIGAWDSQRLPAEVGADQSPLLGTSGEDAVIVTVSDQGTVQSHLSTDGGPFESGNPFDSGHGFVMLGGVVPLPDGGWLALGSGGTVERDGDTELRYDPLAFRSDDGLAWELVEVSGFTDAVEINDLEVVDGVVVAAGSYRTAADPSMGGFEAQVWTSSDGGRFTEEDLPGVLPAEDYRQESYAGHLAVSGDRLLAAGRVDDSAAVWSSDDGARSWQRVDDADLTDVFAVSALATVGDVVIAGTGEGLSTALRSDDDGATWDPVDSLPPAGEDGAWAPVWGDGQRFWTLTGVDSTDWSRPEVCYADLDQCGQEPDPAVVVSPEGSSWSAVRLPGEPEEIRGTSDGRVLVLGVEADGVVVHTLAAGTAPPEAPEATEPETVELRTLREGEPAEIGMRYHAPMYVHCGMSWFWFGDATWRRTDNGPDVDTGAGDAAEDWPVVGQMLYGYAELTDADRLEYSTDDEVIATYRRDDNAPGCD